MHRHRRQDSALRSRASFALPSQKPLLGFTADEMYSSFDPVPGTPAEWLMKGILSGDANPALIQVDEIDALLRLAESQLQSSTPENWAPTLEMLSRILTCAQTPEIGVPVSSLLTDTFIRGGKEMQAAIRKVLPEIDSLVLLASANKSYL